MAERSIHPENTRIRKSVLNGRAEYDILIASVVTTGKSYESHIPQLGLVRTVYGDHAEQLTRVCDSLEQAHRHAANDLQKAVISAYLTGFHTGDVEAYRESQKSWIRDKSPSVESIIGFVEPYRDPFGVRAEFEGLVAVINKDETKQLETLVKESSKFIQRLPWGQLTTENEGKGPFERPELPESNFTSIHSWPPLEIS